MTGAHQGPAVVIAVAVGLGLPPGVLIGPMLHQVFGYRLVLLDCHQLRQYQ